MVHRRFPQSPGYLNDEEEQALTFLGAKGVATGDIGRFDKDGYLYIIGRKKQIIITQGGYKLQPEPIEREIERCFDVSRVVLFGGGELPVLVALVCLQGEDSAEARHRVREHIDHINLKLPPPSRIGRTVFTPIAFTRENGLLTRNLKINRPAVYRLFHSALMGVEAAAVVSGDKIA
jgi:long-subunit acyl-CoA synthetase (AMP-forming)